MAKPAPLDVEFETMGGVLDAAGIKRTEFGEKVGWFGSSIPMKLNRKRSWTAAEYEAAFELAKKYRLGVSRQDMLRYATRLEDNEPI